MNWEILAASRLVENLGWTLLHTVWQFALIAFILLLLRRVLPQISAHARYTIAVCALGLALVLPVATFLNLSGNTASDLSEYNISSEKNFRKINQKDFQGDSPLAPASSGTQRANADRQNIFGSIDSLQAFFDRNFSTLPPFIVGFWIFGVALFSLRLAGGVRQLRAFKTRQISAPNPDWQERFSALCEKLKISRSVKLLQSNLVETPIVVGFLKPVILIPASVFLQISPRELETVIAHELVHVRRCDPLVNFAQSFIEVLFFYHPCVWWISGVIRKEREFAADEAVIKSCGASRLTYASALANLEEIRQTANQTTPLVLAAANGGNLMQRIAKILEKNTETRAANSLWSAMLALTLISAVVLGVFSTDSASFVNAQTKPKSRKLAIGFVSIPPNDRTADAPNDAQATMRSMIEKLHSHKIPAIGFLQGGSVSDGEKLYPAGADTVRLWRDAGFEIGIGGFRHIWFYNTPYEDYVANVEKNERVARQILAEKNLPLRFFSYPFLNTGKTAQERTRFESWLASRGITPVKYTIDNQEWMYSYAYDAARNAGDMSAMNEIRVAFINYMSEVFDHYEAYSQEMFGRDISQTLVLTPSRLVADSADDLFGMIERHGYQFVSMKEALKDEAYQTPENFYGKAGISWFERWQMARGAALRNEAKVSPLVEEMWESRDKKQLVKPPPPPPPPAPPEPPAPPVSKR